MKMGGTNGESYKSADRVISVPQAPDFRQTTAPMGGAGPDYTGHPGVVASTPDFPDTKPPMGGTDWGEGCEPKIGNCSK